MSFSGSVETNLRLAKGRALGLPAVARATTPDIHMFRMTLVVGIVHALFRLAVDTDCTAGVLQRTYISVITSLGKALAAGSVTIAGMTSSHHNIPFTAIIVLIIAAILHTAF